MNRNAGAPNKASKTASDHPRRGWFMPYAYYKVWQSARERRTSLGFPDQVAPGDHQVVKNITDEVRGSLALSVGSTALIVAGLTLTAWMAVKSLTEDTDERPVASAGRPGMNAEETRDAGQSALLKINEFNLRARILQNGFSAERLQELMADGAKTTEPVFYNENIELATDYVRTWEILQKTFVDQPHLVRMGEFADLLKNDVNLALIRDNKLHPPKGERKREEGKKFDVSRANWSTEDLEFWLLSHPMYFFDPEQERLFIPALGATEEASHDVLFMLVAMNDARNFAIRGNVDYFDNTPFEMEKVAWKSADSSMTINDSMVTDTLDDLDPEMSTLDVAAKLINAVRDIEEKRPNPFTNEQKEFYAYVIARKALASGNPRVEIVKNQLIEVVKKPSILKIDLTMKK